MKADSIQNSVILFIIMLLSASAHRHRGMRRGGSLLRVHQGKNVTHEQYPYVMVLAMNTTVCRPSLINYVKPHIEIIRACTCSLIRADWVLIAAHCLYDVETCGKECFHVKYGDLTVQPYKKEFQRNIRKFFMHFGFSVLPNSLKNDIGLLMIDPIKDIPLGQLSAIDYKSLIGYPVKYLGAGGTYSISNLWNREVKLISDIEEKDQTQPLHSGEAIVVTCSKKSKVFQAIYPGICLHSKCSNSRQSPMLGDSGGPLLYKNKIIGVASVIDPGTMSHVPQYRKDMGITGSVYTAVGLYLEWINRVISQEGNCSTTTKTRGANRRVTMS